MCTMGTVTTLQSVIILAAVLFKTQNYVLTYKFSQDHLQLFFNAAHRSGNSSQIFMFLAAQQSNM